MKRHIKSLVKIRNYGCNREFCKMQLSTAGLLIIKQRKLLLAFSKNKQCFYLPGGKVDEGETAVTALCREAAEELNLNLGPKDLEFFTHVTAPAYGEKDGIIMEQDCFFINRHVAPVAAAEIGELRYFSLADYLQEPRTAPGAVMILRHLQSRGLVD
jgi:8-oxo-dGTP pyrophosphatase MutT (NUDIX family)